MTKDEALKLAQEVCPYFDERLKGAFYEGFITALEQPEQFFYGQDPNVLPASNKGESHE